MPNIPLEVYAAVIVAVFVLVELVYKQILRPVLKAVAGFSVPEFEVVKPGLTAFFVLLVSFAVAMGFEDYFLNYSDPIERYGAVFVMLMSAAGGSVGLDAIKTRLENVFSGDTYGATELSLSDGYQIEDTPAVIELILAEVEIMQAEYERHQAAKDGGEVE